MKLLLLYIPLVLASPCKIGPLPTDDFTLQVTNNPHLAPLSAIFNHSITVSQVLDSANRDLTKKSPPVGKGPLTVSWTWNAGDSNTLKWVPQGITSSADADPSGKHDGRESLLVSWYSNLTGNVRVSFVDRAKGRYRHALLVEPSTDDNYVPVDVHAGGIVWSGDQLYVVDTTEGIRVFDMKNIWEVEIGDKVGKVGDKYTAAGYRTDSTLLVGEFVRDSSKNATRFTKYPLSTDSLRTNEDVVKATFAHCVNFERMQGAFALGDKFHISRSNGRTPKAGDLFRWTVGKTAEVKNGWFMAGNEDLSYNSVRREYYTVSEYEKERFILGYKYS
ncbi:hypothetical protein EYZ11_009240 [Aspergillus tanneri]|uniref:Uncharacterized protein n=1 Tax=Aspergillus tanneri TaxID=1220188 RepID=A0A4S3J8J9_9EURO|nr:uncharacterized protein ATNIH1004_000074 [Aspergillus tanneri]KAA8651196.1 hypothetical protein ATNIH1004_000074 [Aspergillus tanneri]THC91290.1 hypothetical protein EYZ11_009240 [Aspergillus tanneri]